MPPVPEAVRERIRAEADGRAAEELHGELKARDPETAARLNASDRQRILRALEVIERQGGHSRRSSARGRRRRLKPKNGRASISLPTGRTFIAGSTPGSTPCSPQGALGEVEALVKRGLDPTLPVMRAHGVPHLIAHLKGWITLAEAAERSKLDTRHYAKRQFTWARRQMTGFRWVAPEEAANRALALGGAAL